MATARIISIASNTAPLIEMTDYVGFLGRDPGGENIADIVKRSAIDRKGMAVNPLVEDPRSWPTGRRMERSSVEARQLGAAAITAALNRAAIRAEEVGFLATVTTTAHSMPGLDALAGSLGMAPSTQLASLGPMGCYAALPGLAACSDWVKVHNRPAVLMCVDVFSPHLQPPPYDKEMAVVVALFGDGAAAVVIQPGEPGVSGMDIVDTEMITAPEFARDIHVHLGERGMIVRLTSTVPDAIASLVGKPVDTLLSRNGLRRDNVARWIAHPGGRSIIDRVEQELALPQPCADAARAVMRDHGNTASAGVLTVLEHVTETRPLGPGQHGVALAFGPGATIWSVLLRGA